MAKALGLHFLKGILAGLSIGLGGFLYILMTFLVPGEGGKVLGSFLFAIGLFLVCTFFLSLYTGKIGIIFEKKQDRVYYASLPIILIGNAVGAIGLGYLCYAIFKDQQIMTSVNAAVSSRLALNEFGDFLGLCLKSFLCGFCVYMAVKLFAMDRLKWKGIMMLVFFVFLFVYCGFQHCIANMFYFGFGNAYAQANTYINLILCIIFNSFGPILGVLIFKIIENFKKQA